MRSPGLSLLLRGSPLDPATRDYAAAGAANGGLIDAASLRIFDAFVRGCKSDGIWDALLEVGFFVGWQNLSGALVKLKAPAGVQRVLTNNNFVSGDYTATGANAGLLGNGTTKNLGTGFVDTTWGSISNFHISVYNTAVSTAGENRPAAGAYVATNQTSFIRTSQFTGNNSDFSVGTIGGGDNGSRVGMTLASCNAGQVVGYANGVAVNTRASGGALSGVAVSLFGTQAAPFQSTYNGRISAYTIGAGLTAAQVLALFNRVDALMRAFDAFPTP